MCVWWVFDAVCAVRGFNYRAIAAKLKCKLNAAPWQTRCNGEMPESIGEEGHHNGIRERDTEGSITGKNVRGAPPNGGQDRQT